jgi:hypothetical protein
MQALSSYSFFHVLFAQRSEQNLFLNFVVISFPQAIHFLCFSIGILIGLHPGLLQATEFDCFGVNILPQFLQGIAS